MKSVKGLPPTVGHPPSAPPARTKEHATVARRVHGPSLPLKTRTSRSQSLPPQLPMWLATKTTASSSFGNAGPTAGPSTQHQRPRRKLSDSGTQLPAMPKAPALDRTSGDKAPDKPSGELRWASDPKLPRNLDADKFVEVSRAKLSSILDPDEVEWLQDYTNNGHEFVNGLLRCGDSSEAWIPASIIDKLVANGLAVEGMVFRGLSDHRLIREGGTYSDPAPASCSVSPRVAEKFVSKYADEGVVLHMIGRKAANISGASKCDEEAEALGHPAETFDVALKAFDRRSGRWKALLVRDEQPAPEFEAPQESRTPESASPKLPQMSDLDMDLDNIEWE